MEAAKASASSRLEKHTQGADALTNLLVQELSRYARLLGTVRQSLADLRRRAIAVLLPSEIFATGFPAKLSY